jgi:hypothetical protein
MEALVENEDPIEALTRYSTSRAEEAHQLVELGRAVGEQQVTGAPDWSTMEQESFTEWRANSSLSRLYYHSTSSE